MIMLQAAVCILCAALYSARGHVCLCFACRHHLMHVATKELIVTLEAVDEALGRKDTSFPLVRMDLQ